MTYTATRDALIAVGIPADSIRPGRGGWDVLVAAGDYNVPMSLAPDGRWLTRNPRGSAWTDIATRTPQDAIAVHREHEGEDTP